MNAGPPKHRPDPTRSAGPRGTRRAALLVIAGALLAGSISLAQDGPRAAPETSIKAAYLLKLPGYVEWPAPRLESQTPLTIGVLGADDVAEELASIAAGRTVDGRAIRVRRIVDSDNLDDLHVLFFRGGRERAERVAETAAARSILTVTDRDGAAQNSVIGFVTVGGRVRFEVDLPTAQRNGLRLSSGLLAVAARVHGAR